MQAVIPVAVHGQPPLSVSLMGLHKSDRRLLAIAAKLAPLIAAAAAKSTPQQVLERLLPTAVRNFAYSSLFDLDLPAMHIWLQCRAALHCVPVCC